MPVSKSCQTQIHDETKFDIEVKGQGQTEGMNVRYTSFNGDTFTCKTQYEYVKGQKSCGPNTKPCHKPYKFDLGVKDQRRVRTMNERHTFSHGDNLCFKYGKVMSRQKIVRVGQDTTKTYKELMPRTAKSALSI